MDLGCLLIGDDDEVEGQSGIGGGRWPGAGRNYWQWACHANSFRP